MKLEDELTAHLHKTSVQIKKETDYDPTMFRRMIEERGGLATAKFLINNSKPSEGYIKLWERRRLNLTVEAQILENPKYHPLFDEKELKSCQNRLKDYGYSS